MYTLRRAYNNVGRRPIKSRSPRTAYYYYYDEQPNECSGTNRRPLGFVCPPSPFFSTTSHHNITYTNKVLFVYTISMSGDDDGLWTTWIYNDGHYTRYYSTYMYLCAQWWIETTLKLYGQILYIYICIQGDSPSTLIFLFNSRYINLNSDFWNF